MENTEINPHIYGQLICNKGGDNIDSVFNRWYWDMEYYSAIRKILLFVTTWMDQEGIKLSEISQTNTI